MSSFQQLESFSPEHTVGTLQALARLGQRPPGMWLGELANKVGMAECLHKEQWSPAGM